MKYFKLSLLSLCEKIKLNIAIVLQLIIVFCIVNILVASLNSRTMLSDAYDGILDKQGYYYYNPFYDSENDTPVNLEGDLENFSIRQAPLDANSATNNQVTLVVCSDDYFGKLKLPVYNNLTDSESPAIISANNFGVKSGDTIDFVYNGKKSSIKITGVLTDPAYIPNLNQMNYTDDVLLFYKRISLSAEETTYIIVNTTTFTNLGFELDEAVKNVGEIFYYTSQVDDETYNKNMQVLENKGFVRELSDIYSYTQDSIQSDYKNYVPLALLAFFVIIIGVVCGIAIQSIQQMRNYSIYFLCGLKWNKIIYINLANIIILLLISILISSGILNIIYMSQINNKFGLVFNSLNIVVTILMILVVLVLSMVIPIINNRKKTPNDVLRSVKND